MEDTQTVLFVERATLDGTISAIVAGTLFASRMRDTPWSGWLTSDPTLQVQVASTFDDREVGIASGPEGTSIMVDDEVLPRRSDREDALDRAENRLHVIKLSPVPAARFLPAFVVAQPMRHSVMRAKLRFLHRYVGELPHYIASMKINEDIRHKLLSEVDDLRVRAGLPRIESAGLSGVDRAALALPVETGMSLPFEVVSSGSSHFGVAMLGACIDDNLFSAELYLLGDDSPLADGTVLERRLTWKSRESVPTRAEFAILCH
jgi:hypothetical protein